MVGLGHSSFLSPLTAGESGIGYSKKRFFNEKKLLHLNSIQFHAPTWEKNNFLLVSN